MLCFSQSHYALYKIINNQKHALFVLYNIISLPTPILDRRKHLSLLKNQKLFYITWIPDILEKESLRDIWSLFRGALAYKLINEKKKKIILFLYTLRDVDCDWLFIPLNQQLQLNFINTLFCAHTQ
jgi:hypothetical protein